MRAILGNGCWSLPSAATTTGSCSENSFARRGYEKIKPGGQPGALMLSKVLRLFELPLLAKELNEQAARKRTYILRFAYAALLFVGACGLFYGNFLQGGNGSSRGLGQGKLMFEKLVKIQFVGIYLFVPAISCSC